MKIRPNYPASSSNIFVAVESYTCREGNVTAGVTLARGGHPVMRGRRDFWQPVERDLHYDVPSPPPAAA